MDPFSDSHLPALLAADPDAGLQAWRTSFFSQLDRRRHQQCQALLALLEDSPHVALQLAGRHYRAVLLIEQHQYDVAEATLRELLAGDLLPEQRARSLLELAILLDELGQWPAATAYYREAEQAYTLLHNELGRVKVLNNLAISLCFQVEQGAAGAHQLAEALRLHEQNRALAEILGEPAEVAKAWHGLGKVYGRQKEYAKAEQALLTYLALAAQQNNDHARGYTLTDLAHLVYLPQGRLDLAAARLDEAIDILATQDDLLNYAEALTHRGNVWALQGQREQAIQCFDQALASIESIRLRQTSPITRLQQRATTELIYAAPLTFYLETGDAEAALTVAERSRAQTLAAMLAGQGADLRKELPPALVAERDALIEQLDAAYAGGAPEAVLEQWERSLAELDQRLELLDPAQIVLRAVSPLAAGEIQSLLAANEAILCYLGDARDRVWIVYVTATQLRFHCVQNVSMSWLQSYLADHLDGTRRGALTPAPRTGQLAPPRIVSDLYKVLVEPVAAALETVTTIYIVPAGPLYHVPVGALTPEPAEGKPLLAGRRIVYTPSLTILFQYCQQRPLSPNTGILAVAPPDQNLRFLSGAATYVAQLEGGEAWIGPAASRRGLLAGAERFRTICFLGHALFDRRYPMASRLLLADGSLDASAILRSLHLDADLVVLAACETAKGEVLRGDELLGLSRALLYAGAPALIATLWRVHEIPTRLLVEYMFSHSPALGRTSDAAVALSQAQMWLRALTFAEAVQIMRTWDGSMGIAVEDELAALWRMTHPAQLPEAHSKLFAHPFFWSPYVLIGDRPTQAVYSGA